MPKDKYMVKAFSGALSLALAILVIRVALPEVAEILNEILIKIFSLLNTSLDLASQSYAQ
ncbi:hypothetical protein C0584_04420 [Candidatus Parcubacteria bacterium]|nr:MAG: hypothetical protein C0584_04420 [Candidatus Parcubacteria bacterium]